MNIEGNLIRKLMPYDFELSHNAAKATKNIFCVKSEGAIDHSTVIRRFKKFRSGWKNLDDQVMLGKTMNSEAVFGTRPQNL